MLCTLKSECGFFGDVVKYTFSFYFTVYGKHVLNKKHILKIAQKNCIYKDCTLQ